jgi:hypothetical protein
MIPTISAGHSDNLYLRAVWLSFNVLARNTCSGQHLLKNTFALVFFSPWWFSVVELCSRRHWTQWAVCPCRFLKLRSQARVEYVSTLVWFLSILVVVVVVVSWHLHCRQKLPSCHTMVPLSLS